MSCNLGPRQYRVAQILICIDFKFLVCFKHSILQKIKESHKIRKKYEFIYLSRFASRVRTRTSWQLIFTSATPRWCSKTSPLVPSPQGASNSEIIRDHIISCVFYLHSALLYKDKSSETYLDFMTLLTI